MLNPVTIRAAIWLVILGPSFYLTYGFANWAATGRAHVPSIVFDWERHVPFLAWTIIPYWTTNLFYAASLFICRTRDELDQHARRLIAAQIICVAGFLLFPLRCAYAHPQTSGLSGALFDALMSFDRPFNQAPSLHIALTAILWAKYSAHMSGVPLTLLRGWFLLSGVSTMTTYQHQFIDLPIGLLAGLASIALFRNSKALTIAGIYFTAAGFLAAAAFRIGGAGWLILWPAAALACVSFVYYKNRPGCFTKQNGHMHPAVRILLAPYILGAWINSRLWTWPKPQPDEIAANVWIGRLPLRHERDRFRSLVDLTSELPVNTTGIVYRGIPMLDLLPPTESQLARAARAIDELESARPTLVCCALGYSRSAAAVSAWLTMTGRAPTPEAAIAAVRARRPEIVLK